MRTNVTSSDSGIGYNVRLLQFPNGSAEIRLYDSPLALQPDNPYETDELPPGVVIEPFKGKRVREVSDLSELSHEVDPLESRRISLARTRRMIAEYARCVKGEYFCTFTFDPARIDRTDYKTCCKKMRIFLKNARDRKAKGLQYLAVPELHKDYESWHFHVLLANTGDIVFSDSGIIKDGKVIWNIPGWSWGFSTATKVKDTIRVARYISKYLTKECHALSRGDHRYFVSNNLPKPKKSIFVAEPGEEMELVQKLADSLGLTISWISSPIKGYVGVTYIDLEPYKTEISKEL